MAEPMDSVRMAREEWDRIAELEAALEAAKSVMNDRRWRTIHPDTGEYVWVRESEKLEAQIIDFRSALRSIAGKGKPSGDWCQAVARQALGRAARHRGKKYDGTHWLQRNSDAIRGARHPGSKLTDELVKTLRAEYARGGTTFKELATRIGVHPTTIRKAVRGITYGGDG